jgi:hypothetical protein
MMGDNALVVAEQTAVTPRISPKFDSIIAIYPKTFLSQVVCYRLKLALCRIIEPLQIKRFHVRMGFGFMEKKQVEYGCYWRKQNATEND